MLTSPKHCPLSSSSNLRPANKNKKGEFYNTDFPTPLMTAGRDCPLSSSCNLRPAKKNNN